MRDEQKNFFDKSYHDLVQAPIDIADLMIAEYMKQIDRLQTFKRAVRAAAVAVTEVPTISLPASETADVKQLAAKLGPRAISG